MTKFKYIATPDSLNDEITIGEHVFERNGPAVEVDEDDKDHDMLVLNPTFEVVASKAKTKKLESDAKKEDEKEEEKMKSDDKGETAVAKQTKEDVKSGTADKIKGE